MLWARANRSSLAAIWSCNHLVLQPHVLKPRVLKSLKLLLLSTPVAPLGSGLGGGVEPTVTNLARILTQFGHKVTIATPAGDSVDALDLPTTIQIIQISGALQPVAQSFARTETVAVGEVLANAWAYAQQSQARYDVLVNFAYDWLPFFLTPFVNVPVAHFVSMGSLSDRMDKIIAKTALRFPGTLGAYTQAQAHTFAHTFADSSTNKSSATWEILGYGLDLSLYGYCPQPESHVAWVGRISPEKGLEDAITAASAACKPLKIYGVIEDEKYWCRLQPQIADSQSSVDYCGFLPTHLLQQSLGKAQALLMTPHWLEAFGIVAIEALACGVPVIAYRQGGPAEIVEHGKTGWLVAPRDVAGLTDSLRLLGNIDRRNCRLQAETCYSIQVWGKRFEQWLCRIASAD